MMTHLATQCQGLAGSTSLTEISLARTMIGDSGLKGMTKIKMQNSSPSSKLYDK